MMVRIPKVWGVHAQPSGWLKVVLGLLPFVLIVAAYLTVSHIRLQENPADKLTPSPTKMLEAVELMAFTKDTRTGTYLMLSDTIASLRRMAIGLGLAAFVGLMLGMNVGVFPGMNATLLPTIRFLSIVPPLSVLPILFIVFGVDELGKVMLIFIGSLFVITRDIHQETQQIPREQIVKALTLGASQFELVYLVLLPQLMPRLLATLRLCLGGAWLFLIASEAIASSDGLGYRIFLVRRYLAMDIIIPYVLWITCLGFAMDTALRLVIRRRYGWYDAAQ
jgi:NitT/TauT family transport system permease protein